MRSGKVSEQGRRCLMSKGKGHGGTHHFFLSIFTDFKVMLLHVHATLFIYSKRGPLLIQEFNIEEENHYVFF